jgi:hypothetical protein
MNGKAGKVQFPKLISHCALATIGLLIIFGIVTGRVSGQLRTIALILPLPLGILLGVLLYFRLAHEVVQYDEYGFTVTKGKAMARAYKWEQFAGVSLFSDTKGGVNIRMYYQPDGEYVDLPATRTGIDPFSLRNSLQSRFTKI